MTSTTPQTPAKIYDTIADVNCGSDAGCQSVFNITIRTISLGGVIGSAVYSWVTPSVGTIDGVVQFRPSGTSVGCFKMTGFGPLLTGIPVAIDSAAAIRALGLWAPFTPHLNLESYYGDGTGIGGGPVEWNAASTTADDGGYCFMPTEWSGPGRFLRPQNPLGFTVDDFGATAYNPVTKVGTASDTAFLNAVNYCMSRGNNMAWPLRCPRNYLITKNNIFGSYTTNAGWINGFHVVGNNMSLSPQTVSSITFQPTGVEAGITDYYFYDGSNQAETASLANAFIGPRITGLTLLLDASNLSGSQTANWFRMSGWSIDGSTQQFFQTDFCWFFGDSVNQSYNGNVLRLIGNANCDQNSFTNCRSWWAKHVISCANPQAVNHKVVACDWELMLGDCYYLPTGGPVTHSGGGSIIMDNTGNAPPWAPNAVYAAAAIAYYDGIKYSTSAGGTSGGAASFTGVIVDNVLTASSVTGTLATKQLLTGTGVTPQTVIIGQLTGSAGAAGTYAVNYFQNVTSTAMKAAVPPVHTTGSVSDGGVTWTYVANQSMYVVNWGGSTYGQLASCTLEGVRIELRTCRAKLVTGGDANTHAEVLFKNSSCNAVAGGFRTTMYFYRYNGLKVRIEGGNWECLGIANGYYEPIVALFGPGPDANYVIRASYSSTLTVTDANVSPQIQHLMTWGNSWAVGYFSMRGCSTNTLISGADNTILPDIATDCDMYNPAGPQLAVRGHPARELKSAFINYEYLPTGTGYVNPDGRYSSFTLPAGAIVKRIYHQLAAGQGNLGTTDMHLVSLVHGTVYATYPTVTVPSGFAVNIDNIMIPVAADDTTLALLNTSGNNTGNVTPTSPLDTWIVEYY